MTSQHAVSSADCAIIVAPARTLGEMRRHYHESVSERLMFELDKDLTGHSVADIEAALGVQATMAELDAVLRQKFDVVFG